MKFKTEIVKSEYDDIVVIYKEEYDVENRPYWSPIFNTQKTELVQYFQGRELAIIESNPELKEEGVSNEK